MPPKFDLGRQSAHLTIVVCAMPGGADDYLYCAISQTQFVFAKVITADAKPLLKAVRSPGKATGLSSFIWRRESETVRPKALWVILTAPAESWALAHWSTKDALALQRPLPAGAH